MGPEEFFKKFIRENMKEIRDFDSEIDEKQNEVKNIMLKFMIASRVRRNPAI